jgi:hypothetical protein
MSEDNSTQTGDEVLLPSELLKQATALCEEMEELMTLHHFYYQAAEHLFGDGRETLASGLPIFSSWLRERDLGALEAINKLQEGMRL